MRTFRRCALPLALLPAALPGAQAPVFEEVHRQAPYVGALRSVALGDVDGDGHVDAYFGAGYVGPYFPGKDLDVVALNDGSGRLVAKPGPLLTSIAGAVDAALRDFDGDGDLDVLRVAGASVELLAGDGSGAFQPAPGAVPPLSTLSDPERLAVGDVDGDGRADALVTGPQEIAGIPSERMLLATASGFALQPLPHTEHESTVGALADFDLDGDLDAYVGKQGQNVILRNDGPAFTALDAPPYAFLVGTTTAVATGDLDTDGDADLLISVHGTSGSYMATYAGDGAGGLAPTEFVSNAIEASDLVLGDLDGDGDLDAAAATAGPFWGGDLFGCLLYFNEGAAGFSAGVPLKKWGNWDFASLDAADLDGDDDLDLVCAGQPDVQVFFGEGGSFVEVTAGQHVPWLSESGNYFAATWLDSHGDGGQDILIAGWEEPLRVYLDDGFGRYAEAALGLPHDPRRASSAAGLDVNADGIGDVLIGYEEAGVELADYLELRIGAGDGTLAPAPAGSLPVVADQVRDIALGDLDGDGDQDALLGLNGKNGGSSGVAPAVPNGMLLSDGPALGTFHDASSQLPQKASRTQAVALGDFDGDGDLDAAVGNGDFDFSSYYEADLLYFNDGTAHFSLAPFWFFPSPLTITFDLEVADFDADGALDILATGPNPSFGVLYTNSGFGLFTYKVQPLSSPIKALDVDLDGDPDVVSRNELFLNAGGQLTESPGALSHDVNWFDALAGDPDRDGEWDLFFVGGGGPCRLFHGVKRQLLTVGVPQLGQPLVLEIRGPQDQPFALALALSDAVVPLPGIGTLMLAPASLGVVASGVLTGSQPKTVTFPAISNPAYLGLTVYWQAMVGSSPKLTNQLKTVALDL